MTAGVIAFGVFMAEALSNRPNPAVTTADLIAIEREARGVIKTPSTAEPESRSASSPANP